MRFVLTMARRELRAAWRRLLFFFVCVAIGVAAIVTLRSIIQSVRAGLMAEARSSIAADVMIQTSRPWAADVRAAVEARLAAAPVVARNESVETATMARAEAGGSAARMVELRGVEAGFPLYGKVVLAGGQPYSHDLLHGNGALVRPELLAQLGVGIGDRIRIGGAAFTVRGIVQQEPGRRVGGFSLGTRVLVDLDDLRRTGLLSFGSRANYQILLAVRDAGVEPLGRDIRRQLGDRFVNAQTYKSNEDQIGEELGRAENFLSLVGFVIVVLGGIGVWSVTRVFVRQKIRSVAILKCVGATTRQVLSTYVLQVGLLALAGSLLGVGIAAVAIRAVPVRLVAAFGGIPFGLRPSAVLQGLTVGLLVSLLFALVPLLDVRRVKPLLLLRGGDTGAPDLKAGPTTRGAAGQAAARLSRRGRVAARLKAVDWLQFGCGLAVAAGLVAIASWQAASWKAGVAVTVGFAAITAVLYGAAFALVRVVAPLAASPWFPLRHAVVNLRRPGNQTRVILMAVGLGSFFVLGVRALENNLITELTLGFDRSGPDMFLIDVQRDQVEGVRALAAERQEPGAAARLVPVLRARVTGVRGRTVNLDSFNDVRRQGSLAREYTITYRDHLEPNERITEGTFWSGEPPTAADAAETEVSIEEDLMHDRFGIGVGDVMRFDVMGRTVQARVRSVRRVEWGDSRSGGFVFVFRPGALDRAPQTYVGFMKGPADPLARARFQYDLVTRYPNVSAIDGREILQKIQTVVDNAVFGVSIVGLIALVSGLLILVGAVAMTRFQRVYEAAILRTLGATTRLLTTMVALEYAALGLLAGVIGAAGALGLSWGVARQVFEIPWRPAPGLLAAGAVLTMVLVGVIGVVASFDVLRKKPLGILRAE